MTKEDLLSGAVFVVEDNVGALPTKYRLKDGLRGYFLSDKGSLELNVYEGYPGTITDRGFVVCRSLFGQMVTSNVEFKRCKLI